MESDAVYFARRASAERAAASRSSCAIARQTHLELAERYEDLARALHLSQASPALRLVSTHSVRAD
jgi:hypothetical protein